MSEKRISSDDSPESKIVPYEDLNTKQVLISGEKFPEVILCICDGCCWCCTSINRRGIVENCPICNTIVSQVPMTIDETCVIELNGYRGLTVRFERKLPLR